MFTIFKRQTSETVACRSLNEALKALNVGDSILDGVGDILFINKAGNVYKVVTNDTEAVLTPINL